MLKLNAVLGVVWNDFEELLRIENRRAFIWIVFWTFFLTYDGTKKVSLGQ